MRQFASRPKGSGDSGSAVRRGHVFLVRLDPTLREHVVDLQLPLRIGVYYVVGGGAWNC
jgi:hypothetical protein